MDEINDCDLVFVCVPTPSRDGHCDISAVEEVVSWVKAPTCLRSTVLPGTTRRLITEYHESITCSPEYVGETVFHPSRTQPIPSFVIVGGDAPHTGRVVEILQQLLGPLPRYFITDPTAAELAKYMENCFLATKVAFVAQFYILASYFAVDFQQVRELWLADDRIGRSHTAVIGELGFGGRCLPKDLEAIITAARAGPGAPLLEAVQLFNNAVRNAASPTQPHVANLTVAK
jgi:UDPglucose 6-dehydrogenase